MAITANLDPIDPYGHRRGARRHRLNLVADARGAGASGNVEILNLSETGMLLKTAAKLSVGRTIEVVLPVAGKTEATIMWTDANFHGCRFDKPLSKAALSASQLLSEPATAIGSHAQPVSSSASPSVDGSSVGERLASLRKSRQMTLHDAAEALDVSKTTVWKWESNNARPRPGALARLSDLYGLSEAELLFGDEVAPAQELPDAPANSVGEIMQESKNRIARSAGLRTDQVTITIEV